MMQSEPSCHTVRDPQKTLPSWRKCISVYVFLVGHCQRRNSVADEVAKGGHRFGVC